MASPLRQILRPGSLDQLLADDYERRPVRFPHQGVRRVDHLVSHEEVDRALWRGGRDLAACTFRCSPEGTRDSFDRPRSEFRDWLLEGYRQGMSIVVTRAHGHFPSLAFLNRSAEIELGGRCSATLVLSPAGYHELSATETFIIQVRGSQSAHLTPPPCPSPLDRQLEAGPGDADTELELEPHDILYLPGGTGVELRPDGDASLHVELHVETYRWVNLLEDMIESAARESLDLRRCVRRLPHGEAGAALVGLLSDKADPLTSAAVALRRRRQVAGSAPLPGSLLTDPPLTLTRDAWVEPVDGSLCHVEKAGDRVTIEFGARRLARVSGPAFIAPALRFIADARAPFRVADIPALGSLEEKLVLANRLIGEGLLRIWEPR